MASAFARRRINTALEMLASGQWVRAGSKHYRHASGEEVRYDGNRWLWMHRGSGYSALWVARDAAEKWAAAHPGGGER